MDCSLKFGYMKKELLVIVYHHDTVDLLSQEGTNYSSGAESGIRNKLGLANYKIMKRLWST